MFAVVGLGNPGRDYINTRHNIGFEVLELLAARNNIALNRLKFRSIYGEGLIGGEKIILIKPQTYMNNSGIALLDLYNFYKIPINNIIVIVDDVDIEFGAIRIKKKGSAGSHNGLKSIIYHLKSEDFPRIKIGIGNRAEGQDLADFVLSRFTEEERVDMDSTIERAASAVETIMRYDLNRAMNDFNRRIDRAQE